MSTFNPDIIPAYDISPFFDPMGRSNGILSELGVLAEEIGHATQRIKQLPVEDACLKFKELKDYHTELVKHVTSISKSLQFVSNSAIPGMFAARGVSNITLSSIGCQFVIGTRIGCSLLNKTEGMDWLKTNGHEGMVTETVNSSSLAAFARGYESDTGMTLPEEVFKTSSSQYTSVRKSKP